MPRTGAGFMAAQAKGNVWTGNGVNGKKTNGETGTNGFLPVQPLDTAEPHAVQAATSPKAKADDWKTSLPSEEEQMEMLRHEEEWSTVKPKVRKPKKEAAADAEPVSPAEPAAPTASEPVKQPPKAHAAAGSRPAHLFTQQSSFAALSTDDAEADEEQEEQEWDV